MRLLFALCAWIVVAIATAAAAQQKVQIESLDGDDHAPSTRLDAYLFRPAQAARAAPFVVFMHGCSGLISATSHRIMSREMDWAAKLDALGIGVLMVDSFATRAPGEECSRSGFKAWVYKRRPADAYGALAYLQRQPFVASDRIALVGWSNGGGATLFAVAQASPGRPARLAGPDFRAAVAFYPGSCSERRMGTGWTTSIPLLILIGGADVWTPAGPCRELADHAVVRGAPVEFHAYPGAYHDFDWPHAKRRELTAYKTRDGVVPISGEDPAAHADAVRRVEGFLRTHLLH
jgi:dienelactone hydrolase